MDIQPGIHWPYCIDRQCVGCMPHVPELPLSPKPPATRSEDWARPAREILMARGCWENYRSNR